MGFLTAKWNWDTAKEVWQEEAREEGISVGLAQGREEGREEGISVGLTQGREEGREIERKEILKLLRQGLSVDEIEERLLKQ
ncbi:hypothetical protein R84B8_03186 [Treponema sp. R8-4-B8]